jgi:uncharacterized protein YbbC (DUF1343 family)
MLCGLDQLAGQELGGLRRRVRGARLGVLTHVAAVDRLGRQTLAVLEELGATPRLIFAPEHGLESAAQAEEPVTDTDRGDGTMVPVVSLYGQSPQSLSPSVDQLSEIDLLLVDLVDVGARYYTYVWTALLAARAAGSAGVHTVVLDRPNPLSGDPTTVEGALQQADFLSFVGLEPLPIRHALTIGEILALFWERDGGTLGESGGLAVVSTLGWERYRYARMRSSLPRGLPRRGDQPLGGARDHRPVPDGGCTLSRWTQIGCRSFGIGSPGGIGSPRDLSPFVRQIRG